MANVLTFTESGIYCPAGNFYIDPWRPVERAIITHAHSDHARYGSDFYLCHKDSKPLLQLRLGKDIKVQTLEYGETLINNGVKVSLHPAGHIIGSAQVRVEQNGEVWVASGDYKIKDDGLSVPFETIKCHTFITESTFGLPIYQWESDQEIFSKISKWILQNRENGRNSVLIAYSLGKAQRLVHHLKDVAGDIFLHGAIHNVHETLREAGQPLPAVKKATADLLKSAYQSGIIIAPPSAVGSSWMRRFLPYSLGICSGWMQVKGNIRRRNADAGFVLSDHADWTGLLEAINNTGAENIFVTHGFSNVLARYLTEECGKNGQVVQTEYGDDEMLEEKSEES